MLKTYYHATPFENVDSIMCKGILCGVDGVVYLTENKEDAARFLIVRGCKDILTVEVVIDDKNVEETFDHSYQFFKCRAFGYGDNIKPSEIFNLYRTKLP